MKIDTSNFKTTVEYENLIAALRAEQNELTSEREFRFDDAYCIGGNKHPYYMKEGEAMRHLRKELQDLSPEDESLGWEELNARYGGNRGRFDVTRHGCHQSTLYCQLVVEQEKP